MLQTLQLLDEGDGQFYDAVTPFIVFDETQFSITIEALTNIELVPQTFTFRIRAYLLESSTSESAFEIPAFAFYDCSLSQEALVNQLVQESGDVTINLTPSNQFTGTVPETLFTAAFIADML